MSFPARLKQARKFMGLTQMELSKAAGISLSMVAQYETDAREPSLSNFVKLVKALKVPADYLLEINLVDLWEE